MNIKRSYFGSAVQQRFRPSGAKCVWRFAMLGTAFVGLVFSFGAFFALADNSPLMALPGENAALVPTENAALVPETPTAPIAPTAPAAPTEPVAPAASTEPAAAAPSEPSAPTEVSRAGVELLDVVPGKTMVAELQNHPIFGKPMVKEVSGEYLVLTYRLPDLPETPIIQLLTKEDRVEGVVIHLETARKLEDARHSFETAIQNVRPITVPDSAGNFREIYPEKGFVFVLEKDGLDSRRVSDRVIQIIAETVKPEFFTVRAARDLKKNSAAMSLTSISADAQRARSLDPENAPASWILAQAALLLEDYEAAKNEVIAAIRRDESVPQYHLTLLETLWKSGAIEDGLRYAEAVKSVCGQPTLINAEATLLRGNLLRDQSEPDDDAAIANHRSAIDMLLPLNKDANPETRAAAKELVFRAYLALALDIVQKEWPADEDKKKAFLWVDAAAEIAAGLVRDEGVSSELLLELSLGAIEVGLVIPECTKVDSYLEKIVPLGEMLTQSSQDPLNLQRIYWRCGRALFGASQIWARRDNSAQAAAFAQSAMTYLEPFCVETPQKVLAALGPIDYDIGVLLAAVDEDPARVREHYDRAIRMIESGVENASSLDNAENGIRLVNIGRFLWTAGAQDEGVAQTKRGIELIEQGIADGVFDPAEIDIPRKNLELMTQTLQQEETVTEPETEAP